MAFNNESPQSDVNMIKGITETYLSNKIEQLKSWRYNTSSSYYTPNKTISTNLKQATLTLNGLLIPTGQFKGKILTTSTVKASAPEGYTFTGYNLEKS